jgi:PucR C-terminal helix-turn-helix domain/GGDEF-like domain
MTSMCVSGEVTSRDAGAGLNRAGGPAYAELDSLLRRYLAGYAAFTAFLAEAADAGSLLDRAALTSALPVQATLLDRFLATVTDERERARHRPRSAEWRRSELVTRLLGGEHLDPAELAYELECHHVGVIARGAAATDAIQPATAALGCRHMVVCHDDGTVWAWLGFREPPDMDALERLLAADGTTVSIGEPGHGLAGWRRSHRQAGAAFLVALRRPAGLTRYGDVALTASMVQDDLLATSLHDLYLAPLSDGRGDGSTLRDTLRAYFAAGRNGASAAAALRVSRQTVNNRLRAVEERVGRPLTVCAAAIEAALRLDELDREGQRPTLVPTSDCTTAS